MHSLPSIVLVLLILRLSSSNLRDFYLRVLSFYFLFFSYLMHPLLLKQTLLNYMTQDCVQMASSKHKPRSFCKNNDADFVILEKGQSKVLQFSKSIF